MQDWPELLLIDKPYKLSSFDIIRHLRRIYTTTHNGAKAPKLGHAGTLDPLATGLMLIGVDQGTKKLGELIKLDKEYIAEVRLGETRSTGDLEGDIIDEYAVTKSAEVIRSQLATILHNFSGTHRLPVSAYSAIKVDGVPMYKQARKAELAGDTILNIPMRDMTIHQVQLLDITVGDDRAVATIRFKVASGTYIRSLAEELGRRMGYPATLQNLRRTKVGKYDLADAYELKDLQ